MTTTTTPATPTCTTPRGFSDLACPLCGAQGIIRADLHNITAEEGLHCDECGEEFGTAKVREFIAVWTPCLAWLDAMPMQAAE